MLNVDPYYRATFDVENNGFNAVADQTLNEPKEDELFGPQSSSDEVREVQQPERKRKKVLSLRYGGFG